MKKLLIWLAVPLVILLGLAALAYVFIASDDPPPADADLRLVRRQVAPEDNGFFAVNLDPESLGLSDEEKDAIPPQSESWDPEIAQEVLKKHGHLLEKIDECLKRPDFQVPEVHPGGKNAFLYTWRFFTDLASTRIEFLLKDGKDKEAFEQALQLVRFGHRLEMAQGANVDCLVGMAIHSKGLFALKDLLRSTKLPCQEIKPYFEGLEQYRVNLKGWHDSVKVEYMYFSEIIDSGELGLSPKTLEQRWLSLFLRPNRTKKLFAEQCRLMLRDQAWWRENLSLKYPFGDPGAPDPAGSFKNSTGLMLCRNFAYGLRACFHRILVTDLHVSVTRLLFALKCHLEAKGELPGSLDELVPAFIQKVPEDPYDGKPLRYSKEKGIIYSVGDDLTDEGGLEVEDGKVNWENREPTFLIDLPKVKSPSK